MKTFTLTLEAALLVLAIGLLGACAPSTSPNVQPVAAFDTVAQATTGQLVSFDASESEDPDGTIESYAWDFDGDDVVDATNGSNTATHTYTLSGTQTVVLTVTDDGGATDTTTSAVEITGNDFPIADITHSPESPSAGQDVTLDASGSTDRDGSIMEYGWDLDGDGTEDVLSQFSSTTTSYSSAGEYQPSVTVRDDDGATGTASTVINVQ